ncbi:hypothetical protein Tco_1097456 [Tanacetum coccineum]
MSFFNAKSDEEEPTFEKTTFDTEYKIKTSLEEPPTDPELRQLPDHLEYTFFEEPSFLHVIISSHLSEQNKTSSCLFLKDTSKPFLGRPQTFMMLFHGRHSSDPFGKYFDDCSHNLDTMLQRCKDANLVLNLEKCHFMVKEGIILGYKVFGAGLEVDNPKCT